MSTTKPVRLSTYFTQDELTVSDYAARYGMNNEPDQRARESLRYTAIQLDRVRSLLGVPVLVSSGYRSPRVNEAVGGSKRSQHMLGQAVDFIAPSFGSPRAVALCIAESHIPFDQLILEYGRWVHISFTQHNPRGDVLTFTANGKTPGISHE